MLYVCVQKFDVTGNLEKFWETGCMGWAGSVISLFIYCSVRGAGPSEAKKNERREKKRLII
jgi:hypothetical protein